MQTVEIAIKEEQLPTYVSWAKSKTIDGGTTKEFEFNGIVFFDASPISIVRHADIPTIYIAKLQCDHLERKRK